MEGVFFFFFFWVGRLDVSLPLNGSIDRASPSWSTNLLDAYITTIDAFAKVILTGNGVFSFCFLSKSRPPDVALILVQLLLQYDNVLAYNVGNEVINLPINTDAARECHRTNLAVYRL